MQASRTAHYAWLYRGSRGPQRAQVQGWPTEVAPKSSTTSPESRVAAAAMRQRMPAHARGQARGNELIRGSELSIAAARAHFIESQIRDAVESGIRQLVWIGPRSAPNPASSGQERNERSDQGAHVEVFRLDADALRAGRGAPALLTRSLVRSARTLFVCDGLLDRTPSAQIQAILRTIGDSCFGSRFACVYLDGGAISAPLGAAGGQKPRCAVPRLGEPTQLGTRFGIESRALPALLAGAGLVLDADVGLSEYVRRALGEVPSDLRGYGCCRLAVAHVRAPAVVSAAPLN
jgi:O-methyltransferase involved in polyketide biosynthesis